MTDLFLIDLAQTDLTDGKPFDGMAFGEFVDMMGREVELSFDDAETFVTNTQAAIEATTTEGGELVGLPIDAGNHDKGDAAGWIVAVELVGKIIRLTPKWTKVGIELIGEGLRRFFSPTVNFRDKVVLGGALVNWPATTDEMGKVLLRPIELSQLQAFVEDDEETAVDSQPNIFDNGGNEPPDNKDQKENIMLEMTQAELDAKVQAEVEAAIASSKAADDDKPTVDLAQLVEAFGLDTDKAEAAQMTHLSQLTEMIEAQATLKWNAKIAEMQRLNRYAELAHRVTGGTPEAPRGIPMDADTIKSELMKLEPEQAIFWGGLCESIVKGGLTEFAELGHGKKTKQLLPVPEYAVVSLKEALKAGNTAESFFDLAEMGDASDYDLSAFEGEK